MSASTESTSAALRRTQEALAASQADLTHVERQLRDAERELRDAERERWQVERDRDRLKENERRWAAECEYAETERDAARADGDRIAMHLLDTTVQRDELSVATDRMAKSYVLLLSRLSLTEAELVSARTELEQLRANYGGA